VFVPITPCRVLDTRAGSAVATRQTPLGAGETYTQNAHGNNGLCTGIPTDASALSLNVTAINATVAGTYLTIWPTGAPLPDASSLNPVPGQPPTPNAVVTDISSGGQFNIFNFSGTVNLLVDINGYYVDHNHDDRYYTRAQIDVRAPLTQTLSVSSAAFSPTSSVFTYVKSGGQGGAYITSPADGQMVAPIDLPNGAIVSAATVYFLDQNPISNLVVDLWCDDLITLGTFSRLAGLQTTGSTFGWRTGPMADLPQTINNDNCSYQLRASATANWGTFGNNLRIKAVKITYQLPG